jgi:hypothetical protein
MKELVKLHNLHTDYVTLQSECRNLTTIKVVETIKWICGLILTQPKTPGIVSGPGNIPVQVTRYKFLVLPELDCDIEAGYNPDRSQGTWNRCQH